MDDILIAADLTLYANPLNAALQSASSSIEETVTQQTEKAEEEEEKEKEKEKEPIAADLTKYESPLEELEKAHIIKELNHENMFQYVSEGSTGQRKQNDEDERHQNPKDDNQVESLQEEQT